MLDLLGDCQRGPQVGQVQGFPGAPAEAAPTCTQSFAHASDCAASAWPTSSAYFVAGIGERG